MVPAISALNGRICANCQQPGNLACSACLLVVYCSRTCQVAHRSHHKPSCTSPLIKKTWNPSWVLERRTPKFLTSGPSSQDKYGARKYFWGNIPALDIIQLASNEGLDYDKDLFLLFVASGDPRNIVKSVGSLPDTYTNRVRLFINDRDFEVVARNLIICLIGLVVEDRTEAVTCMLHVWYSTLIRASDTIILTTKILPLFEDVNRKIEMKGPGVILGKTWTLGKNTCRAELTKEKWQELLRFVKDTAGLTREQAHQIRAAVTLAPQRVDYRDRWLFSQQPAHRVCASRFFDDGLLLPFGASREEFTVPNPTLFQSAEWPMMDSANPLQGWSASEVSNTDSGPASRDLYGKLFYHISSHLASFHSRLAHHGNDFCFLQVDATSLKDQKSLHDMKFARVEVSNISDAFYLGITQTLTCLGVMLQSPKNNPHATLLTLFMNAIPEILHYEGGSAVARKKRTREMAQAGKFFSPSLITDFSMSSPRVLQMTDAVCYFRDFDDYFQSYMAIKKFKEIEAQSVNLLPGGIFMKKRHTVVEKWPLRLKLLYGDPGAQSEFEILQASGHTGHERYMEWKRGG